MAFVLKRREMEVEVAIDNMEKKKESVDFRSRLGPE